MRHGSGDPGRGQGRGHGRGHGHGDHGDHGEHGHTGRHRGGKGHQGGRHGRRRVVDGGELRLLILKLLSDTPRHGYDLIREIEDLTGGAYAPSPGMVYPTLSLMQDLGLIVETESEGTRKAFSVTEAGAAELEKDADTADAVLARLSEIGETQERVGGGPVKRAMENLHQVLRSRMMQDDATKDTAFDAAAILDEAAQRIERL
ncbi:PadR family transcriptional regulator [Rhodospirillaceae bacterium KN72]|uniref:PadR family transcriptional regulator n=1 Tax=Pacificispira spongiicola TaxID=2729598 RepID=A0A7Y0E228_9PROT|nr:PadR family transcriptional regulator [Pacificispira spongiicola]